MQDNTIFTAVDYTKPGHSAYTNISHTYSIARLSEDYLPESLIERIDILEKMVSELYYPYKPVDKNDQ